MRKLTGHDPALPFSNEINNYRRSWRRAGDGRKSVSLLLLLLPPVQTSEVTKTGSGNIRWAARKEEIKTHKRGSGLAVLYFIFAAGVISFVVAYA